MNIFNFLSLIGGLAFFLCGMEIMGDGLKKLSGSRLKDLLGKLTDSPLKAVFLGTVVTAIIQSSSATTVMVVGFVNSGIIRLEQAVGVIMGANIGTTVTSWLLSLSGIQGDNVLLQFLKPEAFSPLMAFVGMILVMFYRSAKKNQIGYILLGFAILMTGMEMMSDAVEPLAEVPEFTRMMTLFTNPIAGMLVGTIITAIIQSSSASVGILQALCATGTVSFAVAIPIIMGQNIGTCITAILSAVGGNRNSKRTALIHLFFNLIGTVTFVLIFYTVGCFVDYPFMGQSAKPSDIAVIHSGFNIAATIFLLPLNKQLVKLSYIALPIREEEEEEGDEILTLLDERFLDEPQIALEQARKVLYHTSNEIVGYADMVLTQIEEQGKGGKNPPARIAVQMEERFGQLNQYLVKISSGALGECDSKVVNCLLQKCGEMKGITGLLSQIAVSIEDAGTKKHALSKSAKEELYGLLMQTFEMLEQILPQEDENLPILRRSALEWSDAIHKQVKGLKKNHMKRLRNGKCQGKAGIYYLDILAACEQIAVHCTYMEEMEEMN